MSILMKKQPNARHLIKCWKFLMLGSIGVVLIVFASHLSWAGKTVDLKLSGTPESFSYISLILTRALEASGYRVQIKNVGEFPTTRLENMMALGEVSGFIMGETKKRNERFLAVRVGMTNNIVGHRILFIPKGTQHEYEHVRTLEDFRLLGKVAGMGDAWADVAIWRANKLPVYAKGGNWKHLYSMVVSSQRGVDYLSRGAQEIAKEWRLYPDLEVEQKLVFVYPKDHILYVTPKDPELRDLLEVALLKAESSGLIRETIRNHYPEMYQFPVNLQNRKVLQLVLPRSHIDSE